MQRSVTSLIQAALALRQDGDRLEPRIFRRNHACVGEGGGGEASQGMSRRHFDE